MKKNGVYLELFDDELPPISSPALLGAGVSLEETIRLKCLFALLFDQTIRIPEQWALSSPACLKVCREIISGYNQFLKVDKSDEPPEPPIEFYCFHSGTETSLHLKASLLKRLTNEGQRLKIDPALDFDQSETAGAARESVSSLISEDDYIRDHMVDTLGDLFTDRETASALAAVLNYEKRSVVASDEITTAYDPRNYLSLLATYAGEIDRKNKLLNESGEYRDFDDKVYSDALTEFFNFDEYKQGPAYFVQLWAKARTEFPAEIASFIEGLGRAGMHNSFASILRATEHSASYTLFKPTQKTELLDGFVGDLYRRADASDVKVYTEDIVQAGENLGSEFWIDLWQSVYQIRRDRKFKTFRDEQVDIIARNPESDAVFADGVHNIVSEINKNLRNSHLKLYTDGKSKIAGIGLSKGQLLQGAANVATATIGLAVSGVPILSGTSLVVSSLASLSMFAPDAPAFLKRFFNRDVVAGKIERNYMARYTTGKS